MKVFTKGFGWGSIMGVLLLLLLPAVSGAELSGALRVRLVEGDVQVRIAETGEWVPASVNMPLVEGDELWVPEGSRSAIQTNGGTHVRLEEETALQVLRVDQGSFQFHLPQGRVYVLNNAPRRTVLQFDTADASIRTFGKSTFRIDIPNGETDLLVFRGTVAAENASGTTRVRSGEMVVLGSDGYAELSPLPPPDDWQEWNERRDRVAFTRGEGYRYLPEELRPYSSDFEENGRWVNVQEYGYVWTPTVVVTGDWAPYRHGRWVWRGGDYVWVGYEPWGWAPYHYGRWDYIARIGWCWVPPSRGDVFWAPGYVGWVRTGDYVAWVPLAPRETYYGYGNYGRNSVNITNVNITQVQVINEYRNINVNNSITVVNQTTFVTGRPALVDRNVVGNVREDFARHRNVVVGRLPIKPVGTSYAPVVRQIPEAKRPPVAVRKLDVKELMHSRPLVKESDRSAIRPQAQPRPLEVKRVENPRSFGERVRERRQVAPPDRGRPQVVPSGRGPQPQVVPAERGRTKEAPVERGRLPQTVPAEKAGPQVMPPDRGKPQVAPPDRGRPQVVPSGRGPQPQVVPAERGRTKEAPVERGRLPQAVPAEKAGPQVMPPDRGKPQVAPPDRGRPQVVPSERGPQPQVVPAERGRTKEAPVERGRLPQTVPAEKAGPQVMPPDRGKPQVAPPDRGRPQVVPSGRGPQPQVVPAERGKTKGAPPEKGKGREVSPDDDSRGDVRGGQEREGERGRR